MNAVGQDPAGTAPGDADPAAEDAEAELLEAGAPDAIETRRSGIDPARHGERLDKLLVTMAGEFSRRHLQGLIDGGHVRIDGVPASGAARRVRVGQSIEVDLIPTAESLAFRPEAMALPIVHEDADLLVIDKPAGWVVHPAAGHWSGTVMNGLLAHHARAATLPRGGIVHRLDKDTSGLMVVGKTLESVTALSRAIAAREVHRQYWAIAHGGFATASLIIDAPIARDPRSRVRMAVVPGGKPARTDVEQLARHDGIAALRCTLHSGRTHQIRVHLSHRGHPLVADALYGGAPALGMDRQALHAQRLRFVHPTSGRELDFMAAPPPDFAAAWQQITDAS